ncbi:MAG TPA: TRAM domain-containing protein [Mycobacteriales bacterium]|nr:TRAM domain-containing protein [Mycobacteriales bacterium]
MSRQSRAPKRRTPNTLVEVLRLLTVVFFIGLGVEVGQVSSHHIHNVAIGPFRGAALGVIVGSGVGYVVGGILGRTARTTADRTEVVLREVSADTLVAGSFGGLVGALIGLVIAWPLFFIPGVALATSLFGIVLVLLSYVGFRVGAAKRDDVLGVIGFRAGVMPRRPSGSALIKLIDTSVAIDGRIVDVVRAGFLHGKVVVIQPVLDELDRLAKLPDPLRRARGRRGLEVLETLRREPFVDLDVMPDPQSGTQEVDQKLVLTCLDHEYALLTLDTNLAKSAGISGVSVLNLHALAVALRPPVVVGEDVTVQVTKPGRESGQGVGYLDDGTMVVVERGRSLVGKDVTVRVSSVVVTANGRLVFADVAAGSGAATKAHA